MCSRVMLGPLKMLYSYEDIIETCVCAAAIKVPPLPFVTCAFAM